MKKRFLVLTTVLALTITSMAGCASFKDSDVALKVNDTEVTAGVANFLARYTQAQYETYYASYLGEDFWNNDAQDGMTYQESTIDSVQTNIENMVLLEQHMEDYKVSLTDDEKDMITKYAKKMVEANDDEINKKISATQENVERVLTLMIEEEKMMDAIEAKADTKVTDKEAAQKAMEYVQISTMTTDESGNSTAMSDDEIAKLKEQAQELVDKAKKNPSKFSDYADELGFTAVDGTFSADNETLDANLVKAADKLKKDGISDVIDGADGDCIYVAHLTSTFDKDATEAQKESIVSDRQQELYDDTVDGWRDDAKITVNDKVWEKFDFTDLSVTIEQEEEEEDTGTETTTEAATESTDSSVDSSAQ